MRLKKYHFIQSISFIVLAGLVFSCKSKSTAVTEPTPVKEERLPIAKAMEVIRNAVVHSEKYFRVVGSQLGYAAYEKKVDKKDIRAKLITIDSMIAVGKGRCWTSLQLLEKIAEPDNVIIYKDRARKIIQRIYDIYLTDYSDIVNALRWSNDSLTLEMELKISDPTWEMIMERADLDNAALWIREKHNIPKKETEYNFEDNFD